MTTADAPGLPRGLRFYKMTGSGNDFVFLDGRELASAPELETIARLCDRHRGVGADGVVVLQPGPEKGSVRFEYWNQDGSAVAMCGNASLCSAQLAPRLGLVASFESLLLMPAGEVRARSLADDRAEIRLDAVGAPAATSIALERGERSALLVRAAIPHLVVRVDDAGAVDVAARGRQLRHHPSLGPEGANVNFVSGPSRGSAFRLRTYERGIEGETLACGTGTVASAVALAQAGEVDARAEFVSTGGSRLAVRFTRAATGFEDVWLEGEARLVFVGAVA